jgi:hypothetical protein
LRLTKRMSSFQDDCTDRRQAGNPPRREAVTWPWPVGARAVLAGAVILAVVIPSVASHLNRSSSGGEFTVAPELVVDPNTAPERVLAALPHVGPTLVRELVSARDDRPFSSLEDAQDRVRGLGPATLARIAPYLGIERSIQTDVGQLASSSSERLLGKARTTRRKPARSKATRQTPKPSGLAVVAQAADLEASRQLSIARHD